MSDEIRENEDVVEQTTQDSPESEAPEQDPGQDQAQEQQPSEAETDADQSETNEVEDTPKDNAAWAKMRVENKQLKQALEQSGVDAEYLDQLRQASQPVSADYSQATTQVDDSAEYGQVTQAVNTAQSLSAQAMAEIRELKNQLENQQDMAARQKYPDLFKNPEFEAIVAEKKLVARMLGKNRTTTEIADEASRLFSKSIEKAQAQATEQAEVRQTQKTQAVAQPQTTTSAGTGTGDSKDELRMRVRRGDRDAQEAVAKNLIADLDF